jgi:hypothetical protein
MPISLYSYYQKWIGVILSSLVLFKNSVLTHIQLDSRVVCVWISVTDNQTDGVSNSSMNASSSYGNRGICTSSIRIRTINYQTSDQSIIFQGNIRHNLRQHEMQKKANDKFRTADRTAKLQT